jgi:DNA ligase-1
MVNYVLPALFSSNKNGKPTMWKVWTEDDTVCVLHGQVDGKQTGSRRECVGKNTGKKNETSAAEQAKLVAQKDWAKKLDKGYKPSKDDKQGMALYEKTMKQKKDAGGANSSTFERRSTPSKSKKNKLPNLAYKGEFKLVYPMLANKFGKTSLKHLDYAEGVYVQPKLDGWRMTAQLLEKDEDDVVVLLSRTGKQFPWFQHLRKEITKMLRPYPSVILDGEVYVHRNSVGDEKSSEAYDQISEMCGLARSTPHENESIAQYHIFDICDTDKTQKERIKLMKKLFAGYKGKSLIMVSSPLVESHDEAKELATEYEKKGYEGAILRSSSNKYVMKHKSLELVKLKTFQDAEATIIGAKQSEGTKKGAVVWLCRRTVDDENVEFECSMQGKLADQIAYYKNRSKYIGWLLTYKYQEYTKDGKPRFPVGLRLREEYMDKDEESE